MMARETMTPPAKAYPELSVRAVVTGVFIGALMTATFTYAGMKLGFSTSGSTVAAILGWGVLRGLLRSGTIVENNLAQTVASGMNTAAGGVVFTAPVLFLLSGVEFSLWQVALACVAGALLGVGFIIPLRRQMIEIERLLFPSGTAVATILRSPAEGIRKAALMGAGALVAAVVFFLKEMDKLPGIDGSLPGRIDFGAMLGLPPYIEASASLSLFALGIGFIAGRNGLFVLLGGIVSYWIITPLVVHLGWGPAAGAFDPSTISDDIHGLITRPLGIGMLLGGALMGIVLTFPAIRAAIVALARSRKAGEATGGVNQELGLPYVYGTIGLGVAALFIATLTSLLPSVSATEALIRAVLVALVGGIWVWFSGIIIAQATGMTDWTPLSGIALLAVVVLLYLTGKAVLPAVLIGTAVSVACAEAADMMQDLKTGHLVGSRPVVQQRMQLALAALGPLISIGVITLLWKTGPGGAGGFGPETDIAVPQAAALEAVVSQVLSGQVDWIRYGSGAAVGALLSFSGLPGLGVIVGISMYLGLSIILPYGAGALARWALQHHLGLKWCEAKGIPVAVGLVVGDGLMTLLFALLTVMGVLR